MQTATLRLSTTRPASVARSRRPLRIENRSLWSLQPDPKFCYKNPEACRKLEQVDLTEAIGAKRMCSVGTWSDHLGDSDEVIEVGTGGVHLLLECGIPRVPMPFIWLPFLPVWWVPWLTAVQRHLSRMLQCIKLEHGGIHVVFEAEGTAVPLDSPSKLFVTDVDSTCTITVDGQKVEKGKRVQLKPGAVLALGDDVQFQVLRNVFAHA